MKHITVLGAGLVGAFMARELAEDGRFDVTAMDINDEALGRLAGRPRLSTRRADLSSPPEIVRAVSDADVVVGAVPGFLGPTLLKAVIEAKKPAADISFSPEDPFVLDRAAKEAGVPAIIDCGVSPGLSNLAAGRAASLLDGLTTVQIFVGGLPVRRVAPWEYRIVFSATDVIEEYTRPARLVRGGRLLTLPALSEVEPFEDPRVGTLEAFLTDGLRTLLAAIRAENLEERTLRYPGHADRMRLLRDAGFFGERPVEAGGMKVRPRAVTERLLFDAWRLPPGDQEFALLKVTAEGMKAGKPARYVLDLFDRTDPKKGDTAMARTTGLPCVVAARLLADGTYREPGVHPLEQLGAKGELTRPFLDELRRRGVSVSEETRVL